MTISPLVTEVSIQYQVPRGRVRVVAYSYTTHNTPMSLVLGCGSRSAGLVDEALVLLALESVPGLLRLYRL